MSKPNYCFAKQDCGRIQAAQKTFGRVIASVRRLAPLFDELLISINNLLIYMWLILWTSLWMYGVLANGEYDFGYRSSVGSALGRVPCPYDDLETFCSVPSQKF